MLGAFFWKNRSQAQLVRTYAFDTALLIFVAAALNVILYSSPHPGWIVSLTFLAGWFISRYSIALRSLRQAIVPSSQMPTVVSGQGFLARLATPLSGVLYGALLARPDARLQLGSVAIFLLVSGFGVLSTYRAFNAEKL